MRLRPAALPLRPARRAQAAGRRGPRRGRRPVDRHAVRPRARPRVVQALADAAPEWAGYPPSSGCPRCGRRPPAWMERRFGRDAAAGAGGRVRRHQGAGRVAAPPAAPAGPAPGHRALPGRSRTRPTRWAPARRGAGRCPSRSTTSWHLDLRPSREEDAARALLLWLNEPGNPTGSVAGAASCAAAVEWARARGSSWPATSATSSSPATRRQPRPGHRLAGGPATGCWPSTPCRSGRTWPATGGFIAGDARPRHYLGEVRNHAGLDGARPGPGRRGRGLGDDAHVDEQRPLRRRRAWCRRGLAGAGLIDDGGPGTFYLWVRAADRRRRRLGHRGPAGRRPAPWWPPATSTGAGAATSASPSSSPDRLELALERLAESSRPGSPRVDSNPEGEAL